MAAQPWRRAIWLTCLLAGLLAACASPALPTAPAPTPTASPSTELVIYNWDTYIDPAILTGFEERFGVTIQYETYANNEELLENLTANPGKYDIVVPTDYAAARMRREGLFSPLDKANIPNITNLDPAFLSLSYDPGNRYCLPYQWGTLGIGYDPALTGREITSWADFYDPAFAGKVSLLNNARDTLGVALLYLGYSPNTTDLNELLAAKNFLLTQASQVYAYAPDTGQELLGAGEVYLAFEWSGDIFQLQEEKTGIRYVIPREGSLIWVDSLCIPAQAPHQDLAEKFINYLLEPEVGAALSNYVRYASPNLAALPLINDEDRNNPAIYPSTEIRRRLFSLADLDPQTLALYEQAMQDILRAAP